MTRQKKFRKGPIIPPEAAPLKALTVTMTVMCYLACLAIGALILIDRAVESWTSGLSREVTVQIRLMQNADIDKELAKAKVLLETTVGVTKVEVLERDAGAKFLEPWLGTGSLDDLPIPRLIRVTIDEAAPPDFVALDNQLKKSVSGASLDTHRRWEVELTRMARALSTLSYAILALICISAIAMVIFATRTVLDANRQVVDVLHLVGAKDSYIAGLLGVGLGVLTFFLLGLAGTMGVGGVADASRGLLFAPPEIAIWSYGFLISVPIIATLICLVTSRVALIRMLRSVL